MLMDGVDVFWFVVRTFVVVLLSSSTGIYWPGDSD
jgi:hypothetical protein